MLNYRYQEIQDAVTGSLTFPDKDLRFVGRVSLDTRTLEKGDLYIAISGERYDGHDFIDEAFKKGASLCIAEKKNSLRRQEDKIIWVKDSLRALSALAAFHRRQKNISVIAITGSCGKTTTKDLLAHFLKKRYSVLKSASSENNAVGVPKTLLRIDQEEVAVLELGSNHPGEIESLSRLAMPTHAILTVIGKAHLKGFHDLEGVRREKLSLLKELGDGATVVYNAEDPHLRDLPEGSFKVRRVGFHPEFDTFASNVEDREEGKRFQLNGKFPVSSPLWGKHQIMNVLLASQMAFDWGIRPEEIGELLERFQAPEGRMTFHTTGQVQWMDDSYNANPTSVKAALEWFESFSHPGRKVLVLGDMLELGKNAVDCHREVAQDIVHSGIDLIILVGGLCEHVSRELVQKGFDATKVFHFSDSQKAGEFLRSRLMSGDRVLLKGSRAMHIERVMEASRDVVFPALSS